MICLHVKEIYNTIMVLQLHPALLKTIRQMKYARWCKRRSFFVSRTLWACGLSFYRTNLDWPPEKKMQDNHYTAGINSVMLNLERYHPRLHSMYCTLQPKNKNKFAKNATVACDTCNIKYFTNCVLLYKSLAKGTMIYYNTYQQEY